MTRKHAKMVLKCVALSTLPWHILYCFMIHGTGEKFKGGILVIASVHFVRTFQEENDSLTRFIFDSFVGTFGGGFVTRIDGLVDDWFVDGWSPLTNVSGAVR